MFDNKLFDELTDEEQEQAILKALNEGDLGKWYWDSVKDNFYTHISCLDRGDYLDDRTVAGIVNECKPNLFGCIDVLSDKMWEWWEDALDYDWNEIINNVITNLSNDLQEDEEDFDEEEIRTILEDYVSVEPPTQEIMNISEVKVVVSLMKGITDDNFNDIYTYFGSSDELVKRFEGTSLEWLVNQQGYTMEQLKQEWENGDTGSKFLKSVVNEIGEVWDYSGLEITFLTKMNVTELFKDIYSNTQNGKITQQLTISKDTMCGFLDGWGNGVCGYFIELEKDVVIPANMSSVISVFPDEAYRYGPDNICGFSGGAWKGEVKIG